MIICGNSLIADKFKCPFDPKNRQCRNISWWICRNYQVEGAQQKKEDDQTA
jgi:hypothetical protein